MSRLSSHPEEGSALIEAVAIGSVVFLIVMASVAAAVDVSLAGDRARAAARTGAVHAARHAGLDAAVEMAHGGPGRIEAERREDAIAVVVVDQIGLPHPDGARSLVVVGAAEVPLAPYRSDRG